MSEKIYRAVGLMSGTSMDGIDAAIIETDGHTLNKVLGGNTYPYNPEFRKKLRFVIDNHNNDYADVEKELTLLHAEAVKDVLQKLNLKTEEIDYVGFHGHTIYHAPAKGITIQIGDGALLAKEIQIPVVNDFRSADVKAGGQGAPLVPIYHQALVTGKEKPIAIVNIGGVANVTWIGKNEGDLLAFDTGPGNALLDEWIEEKTGDSFDKDGAIASSGKVDSKLLAEFMDDTFYKVFPPKSLDRKDLKNIDKQYSIKTEDGAATLAAYTAETIISAEKFFPYPVKRWLITGGGRHNTAIMRYLRNKLAVPVDTIDSIGPNGDLVEAQAFGFLAVRSILGLPISFPGTTGIKEDKCGGKIYSQ